MADTINAITLTGDEYESVSSLTGIAVGTGISIQNQTTGMVYVAISPTKPLSDFRGEIVPDTPMIKAYIGANESEVWLKGDGPVSVQEV